MTQKVALNVFVKVPPKIIIKTRKEVKVSIISPEPTESTQSTLITFSGPRHVKLH